MLSSLTLHVIIIIAMMIMMMAGVKSRASYLGAGVPSLSYSPSPSASGFESVSSLNLEPAVGLQVCAATVPDFHMGVQDSNPGLHTCSTSALPTELSP